MARLLSTQFLHFASFNFLLVHQGHVLLFHPNHRRSNRKSQVYIYSYISYIYRNIILFIASVYCRPLLHNIPPGCRMRKNKFQSMTMWKMRHILDEDEHWDTPDKYNHLSISWCNFHKFICMVHMIVPIIMSMLSLWQWQHQNINVCLPVQLIFLIHITFPINIRAEQYTGNLTFFKKHVHA